MLSAIDLKSGRANYYLSRAKLEYLQGQNGSGLYYGKGAAALGLTGKVHAREFKSLFRGALHGRQLVKTQKGKEYHPGVDLCFSAPKSVSTLWAVSDDQTRGIIERCCLQATKRGLDYLEESATEVRLGKGGVERARAGMVSTIHPHSTNRLGEPQLHHHVCMFGLGVFHDHRDGQMKTRKIAAELPFLHRDAAGAVYRAELARLLEKELHVTTYRATEKVGDVERVKETFDIRGVLQELMNHWSKRSAQIAAFMEEAGLAGGEAKQAATLATRDKSKHFPITELFPKWKKEAEAFGFRPESVLGRQTPPRNEARQKAEAVQEALVKVTRENAHFAERDLVKQIGIEAQGRGLGYHKVMEIVRHIIERSTEVVRLGSHRRNTNGPAITEPRFTTRAVLELEAKLFSLVEEAKGKKQHRVSEETVTRAIAATEAEESKKQGKEIKFSPDQVEAVKHLASGENQIAVMTGDAGTGKTTCLAALRKALAAQGFHCIGASLAKKAALGLEEGSGIASTSVAKLIGSVELGFKGDLDKGFTDELEDVAKATKQAFLRSLYDDLKDTPLLGNYLPTPWRRKPHKPERVRVDAKTVLVVDEAAQLGTRSMEKLIRQVLERGGKVILSGDVKQQQPIGHGQPFAAIARILGEQARLTRVIRQRTEADRKIPELLSHGEAREALELLTQRGLVHVAPTPKQAVRELISAWKVDGVRKPQDNLIVCATNAERAALNRLAQVEMERAGKLGRKKVQVDGLTYRKGDRIAFTKNNSYIGVENGSTGTILRIGKKRITRKLFHGKDFLRGPGGIWRMLKYAEAVKRNSGTYLTVKLDSGKVVDVSLDHYQHFRLGYAYNTVQAQGMSVERAFVLAGGPTTSLEQFYVQASRTKTVTNVFTDAIQAGDGLKHLARKVERSRRKEMAHDLLRRSEEAHSHRQEMVRWCATKRDVGMDE